MKTFFSFLDNFQLILSPVYESLFSIKNGKYLRPAVFYSFVGLSNSVKYIPGNTDIVQMTGGRQFPDQESGERDVAKVYWENEINHLNNVHTYDIKRRSIWVWIASTSLILFFSFLIIRNRVINSEIDSVFQKFYRVPEFSSGFFTNPAIVNDKNWILSIQAFNDKNFLLAHSYLKLIPESSSLYDYSCFLNTICLMQENHFGEALEKLLKLRSNSTLLPVINWYAGLCYIKQGNLHSAGLLFQTIKDQKGIFEKKAAEILRNINAMH